MLQQKQNINQQRIFWYLSIAYLLFYSMCTDRSKLVITPQDSNKPGRVCGEQHQAADLWFCHGGIMRIGRKVIVSAIISLSVAGSIFATSAAATTTVAAKPATVYYHG
jgi:hypothetical protein